MRKSGDEVGQREKAFSIGARGNCMVASVVKERWRLISSKLYLASKPVFCQDRLALQSDGDLTIMVVATMADRICISTSPT